MSQNYSLEELLSRCREQRAHFQRTFKSTIDSSSCAEIIRRAVQGDDSAMAIVIELIAPDIRTHTARVLGRGHPDIEDVQQTVNMKLFRRLRDPINPFRVDSFPSFLKFVQLTVRGVAIDWRRAQAHTPSPLPDDGWREPIQPSEVNQVERQASRARLLELIPDERDRELFRRFLLLDESPATVHAVMRQRYSDLTITDVYRTLERVLRQLSKLPEVREMYESNAE